MVNLTPAEVEALKEKAVEKEVEQVKEVLSSVKLKHHLIKQARSKNR